MNQYHLGISAFFHDSAAALVTDSKIVCAAQQERFSRKRHDSGFPADAVRFCLEKAGLRLDDLATISYYEDPKLKLERTLSSFASAGPGGLPAFSRIMPDWIRWKAKAVDVIEDELRHLGLGDPSKVIHSTHHRSHAASAFYPSPYETAAVLCIDGVGEWHTTSIWHGKGNDLTLVNSISFPHSLGLLYSAFTYFCGFKVDSGEYKLMGLAPYGEPIHADKIRDNLIELREDGSFSLNLEYFSFLQGERMVGSRFADLFDRPRREPESALTQSECDLAASVQKVTNEAIMGLARAAKEMTGEAKICMAGGVALNCVANGHLSRSNLFSDIWIQPAAGDAGCALGTALDQTVQHSGKRPNGVSHHKDAMAGALLGPDFSPEEIRSTLDGLGASYRELEDGVVLAEAADHLAEGRVVGWFQGAMEFGPRALGARSILGDPRHSDMQKTMNLKIKFRESFRPFAPAVLAEEAGTYFDVRHDSPYMLLVSPVLDRWLCETESRGLGSINELRSQFPAITHVDNSARVQTVHPESNPRFSGLLEQFRDKAGCPIVVNTSFNVRGEPIVCSPADAYICFMRTNIEVLVLNNFILLKEDQPEFEDDIDWRNEIALD